VLALVRGEVENHQVSVTCSVTKLGVSGVMDIGSSSPTQKFDGRRRVGSPHHRDMLHKDGRCAGLRSSFKRATTEKGPALRCQSSGAAASPGTGTRATVERRLRGTYDRKTVEGRLPNLAEDLPTAVESTLLDLCGNCQTLPCDAPLPDPLPVETISTCEAALRRSAGFAAVSCATANRRSVAKPAFAAIAPPLLGAGPLLAS
jgi:hypothetical protein